MGAYQCLPVLILLCHDKSTPTISVCLLTRYIHVCVCVTEWSRTMLCYTSQVHFCAEYMMTASTERDEIGTFIGDRRGGSHVLSIPIGCCDSPRSRQFFRFNSFPIGCVTRSPLLPALISVTRQSENVYWYVLVCLVFELLVHIVWGHYERYIVAAPSCW